MKWTFLQREKDIWVALSVESLVQRDLCCACSPARPPATHLPARPHAVCRWRPRRCSRPCPPLPTRSSRRCTRTTLHPLLLRWHASPREGRRRRRFSSAGTAWASTRAWPSWQRRCVRAGRWPVVCAAPALRWRAGGPGLWPGRRGAAQWREGTQRRPPTPAPRLGHAGGRAGRGATCCRRPAAPRRRRRKRVGGGGDLGPAAAPPRARAGGSCGGALRLGALPSPHLPEPPVWQLQLGLKHELHSLTIVRVPPTGTRQCKAAARGG